MRVEESRPFFKVYPNPTSGLFILELNQREETSTAGVEVFTIYGKVIFHNSLSGSRQCVLSLKDFPSDVYFIRVSNGGQSATSRIIKQ
jgi:hypothetical protein